MSRLPVLGAVLMILAGWAGAEEPSLAKEPKLMWTFATGGGALAAPPAVVGDRVVVGGPNQLMAVDVATGKRLWERRLDDSGPGAVVTSGETAYVTTESCTLYSVPTKSGGLAWKKWLGSAVFCSPAVVGDRLYVSSGTARDGHFYLMSIDRKNGATDWQRRIPAEVTAAPTVVGEKVFFSLWDGSLHALSTSGKKLWEAQVFAASPPVVGPKSLFVNARLGTELTRLDPATGKVAWTRALTEARGTATKERGTASEAPMPVNLATMASTPVPAGEFVFVGSQDGAMACVRADSGEPVWRQELGRAENGQSGPVALSSPAVVREKVYVGSASGGLYCLDATRGKVLWSYQADSAIRWSPIVHQGKVLFNTEAGTLHCLDTGDPTAHGWSQWGGNATHTMKPVAVDPVGRGTVATPSDEE